MRLVRSTFVTLVLGALGLTLAAAPAMASQAPEIPELVAVRCAHHPGFDRVTFEFRGGSPGKPSIRYVRSLTQDPSGKPVHLAGGAILQVVFHGVNAHDPDTGKSTVASTCRSPGLPVLREVAPAGDFEAVVTYGLSVIQRLPVKALELSNPPRVAIDITAPASMPHGAGTGETTGSSGAGSLPFTGARTTGLLITGLTLAATGVLVLLLAYQTRTPTRTR
jgi:hypothetical protein